MKKSDPTLERDARVIFDMVRTRGPVTKTELLKRGYSEDRQVACGPRVNELLEKHGLAA